MTTDEEYENSERSSSFLSNIRRNVSLVTINEYSMLFLVGLSIFLMSGIVYVLAKVPQFMLSNSSGTQIIYYARSGSSLDPLGLNSQYIVEMFIVAGLFALGAYGLYLIKNSTAYIDDQRLAFEVLALGTLIFAAAASLLFFIYIYKMSGRFPYFVGLG